MKQQWIRLTHPIILKFEMFVYVINIQILSKFHQPMLNRSEPIPVPIKTQCYPTTNDVLVVVPELYVSKILDTCDTSTPVRPFTELDIIRAVDPIPCYHTPCNLNVSPFNQVPYSPIVYRCGWIPKTNRHIGGFGSIQQTKLVSDIMTFTMDQTSHSTNISPFTELLDTHVNNSTEYIISL